MIHREKSYAEIYHDGNQGYYYNFDTKIFYIKSFETPNYQKENLENIKKYSSIITFLVLILIPINNWYRTIANLKLNLILAIMFIVIALVVVNKLNNIVSKQKRNIDNISYEKMEFDKEKIANIIVSAEELSNKLLFLLVISFYTRSKNQKLCYRFRCRCIVRCSNRNFGRRTCGNRCWSSAGLAFDFALNFKVKELGNESITGFAKKGLKDLFGG